MRPRTVQVFGAVLALLGVMLGAFGAHMLKDVLFRNQMVDVWHTAVEYQWFHALALLVLARQARTGPVVCWLVGTLFFSGSLYLLALLPESKSIVWPITPLGGLLFIVGWGWFIVNRLGEQE